MPPIVDLHDLLQDVSELINRRLVITDERLRVVAYSIHESDTDRSRLSVVLAHSDSWAVPPAGADVEVHQIAGLGRVVLLPLRDHRYRVGFLLVVLEPDEVALPPALADALSGHAGELGLVLSLRTLYAERDRTRVRTLLGDLLAGDASIRTVAARALIDEGLLGAARQYSAVALGPDPASPDHDPGQADATVRIAVEATIDFVGRTSTASVAGAVIGEGIGILVFPRPVVAQRLERILDRPDLGSVRAGLGPVVTDLTEIASSFERARDAWQVGSLTRASAKVLAWQGIGLERLIVRLPLADVTVADLPEPVRELLAADLGSDIMETLEAYLALGGDAAATSRALHIHRSTLYYRLDRVRAIGDLDLADGILRRDIQTGFLIARLVGLIHWKTFPRERSIRP